MSPRYVRHKNDDCLILNKCIYGFDQAAWQYYKKAIKILKSSSFIRGGIDPCLYVKKSVKGIVYIALYIDNNVMVRYIATIDDAIEALENKGLVLKVMEGLQDYVSCKIKFSDDKKQAWLGQPHLIKNMEKKFGRLVQNVWSHNTPGTPKFLIMRPMVENKKINVEDE